MAYSSKKVQVIVNGTFITGFRDGDKFSYSEPEDRYTPYTGADGETEYAENASNRSQVVLGLKNTSPSIAYLNSLYESRAEIDMTIKDTNTNGMNFSGTGGVIVKRPDMAKGKEVGEVEFTLDFPDHKVSF
ncbi:phage structural protein [Anaerosolibacter sp.]|uniref:phage structural protein n=1 Tax=Anaerosolibacter sp. TaxID=1872527 RepID=UPI0039F0A076